MEKILERQKPELLMPLPNLSEIQRASFCWFLSNGLPDTIVNYPSIINKKSGLQLLIYGQEYKIILPPFDVLEARKTRESYTLSLYVFMGLRKYNPKCSEEQIENSLVKEHVYLGEIPLMTDKGTFLYNGCERIIVNQIVRSPGIYYKYLANEKYTSYEATIITNYGSWLTFELQYNLIWVRIDKAYRIPISWFLAALSLNPYEIYQTVRNYDFLRKSTQSLIFIIREKLFTSLPVREVNEGIRLSIVKLKNILETQIFNPAKYDLGEIGRMKLNNKLGIKIPSSIRLLTSLDIVKIIDSLIDLTTLAVRPDDIDNLANRRVRSVGEFLQAQTRIAFSRLESNIAKSEKFPKEIFSSASDKIKRKRSSKKKRTTEQELLADRRNVEFEKRNLVNGTQCTLFPGDLVNPNILSAVMRELFGASPLSQFLDETNPLAQITHKRRVSSLGPGGLNGEHISLAARDIHPTQYGRLCPIETPEGQRAGLISSLASYATVNKYGFLQTPFFRVKGGKVLKNLAPIFLTADREDPYTIAAADVLLTSTNEFRDLAVPVRVNKEFITVSKYAVDLFTISPIQVIAVGASLIPFLEHDDANRALMGSNMQRQAIPLLYPKKPIVGTGLERQIVQDSLVSLIGLISGIVYMVSSSRIIVIDEKKNAKVYFLEKYRRSNQGIAINQKAIVWPGELIKPGQVLADGIATEKGELALGQNLLVAYMPWEGYNYEDAVLVSERLIREDIFTSLHIEKYDIQVKNTINGVEKLSRDLPDISIHSKVKLDKNGVINKGALVRAGDVLIGKLTPSVVEAGDLPENKLLRVIFNTKDDELEDNSLILPNGMNGRVLDIEVFSQDQGDYLPLDVLYWINVFVAQTKKIKVGDKISGRHGNKGVISKILPVQDMPFLPDGTVTDVILNPLGVPSRMNVGQIFECLLGLAGDSLNCRFKVIPFDEVFRPEASRILVNKKLKEAATKTRRTWLFNEAAPGKVLLKDGRTGETFDNPILVGKPYMLKLIHIVDKKIHARSTGPYSLITQQPLGGRSHNGGQRFGEMEVWALEAYGVAYTLQELLTIKSDDMDGRNEVFDAIIKGHPIPKAGIPESFTVLISELRALGLDLTTHKIVKLTTGNIISQQTDLMKSFKPNPNL